MNQGQRVFLSFVKTAQQFEPRSGEMIWVQKRNDMDPSWWKILKQSQQQLIKLSKNKCTPYSFLTSIKHYLSLHLGSQHWSFSSADLKGEPWALLSLLCLPVHKQIHPNVKINSIMVIQYTKSVTYVYCTGAVHSVNEWGSSEEKMANLNLSMSLSIYVYFNVQINCI